MKVSDFVIGRLLTSSSSSSFALASDMQNAKKKIYECVKRAIALYTPNVNIAATILQPFSAHLHTTPKGNL